MIFLMGIMIFPFSTEKIFNYIVEYFTSFNDLITKIYYPAGVYARLVMHFNLTDLLIFILVNLSILPLAILILSKFYFKINSRLKKVVTISKNIKVANLVIKSKSQIKSIINIELVTFFKTPVFIINAGFALVLFLIATIIIAFKFDSVISILINEENVFNLTADLIMNNLSILIFVLILLTAYMTSITNSVISLEGKNINILKLLPVKVKTILIGKVLASLVITTSILLIGDIILFIVTKINVIEAIRHNS